MDSAVALGLAKWDGEDVTAVSFNYGQRHIKELEAAKKLAEHYVIDHVILDLTGAAEAFKGSALTGGGPVPEGHYEDESMKLTIVPNRNMIMLSLATGLAISRGLNRVTYAAHAGDHAVYEDCRPEFANAMALAIERCSANPPELHRPFINNTKAQIASAGAAVGVPFELTWSCYVGGPLHCALCGTCQERRAAFKFANIMDPTKYDPEGLKKAPEVQL